MKVSLEWLKSYIDLPNNENLSDISDKLTLHTCEVEKMESNLDGFDGIVIGEIKEVLSHPNADKLKITKTDVGGEIVQIVCGGTNVYKGMKCVVAKLGAKVMWHGTDEMVMQKVKLRGEESSGMICSADEVGLGGIVTHADGEVVDLGDYKNLKAGDSIKKLLGEERIVLDIDNKSLTNRPDLWGHYGMARELSAIYKYKLKDLPYNKDIKFGTDSIDISVSAKKKCPRFQMIKLSGLQVTESPDWIKKRLEDAGVRPISNIVDATNYVMLELGQPMHAYDYDKIEGGFDIRLSKKDEKVTTLDGVERKLTGNEVLVCDSKKILGLGGIMGGATTEISDSTTSIYLESANWTKTDVRATSVRLGLRTDASARYEKGLDPYLTIVAIIGAISILKETCPDLHVDTRIENIQNFVGEKINIKLDIKRVNTVSGLDIPKVQIVEYLVRLGFVITKDDDNYLFVEVHSFRATGDISIEEDLIEEITRMVGYDNIEEKNLLVESKYSSITKMNKLERNIRDSLVSVGLTEVMTYSFVSASLQKKIYEDVDKLLEVTKPLSSDLTHLRDTLVPRILEISEKNKTKDLKIFEIGHVHFKDKKGRDNLPVEEINLSVLVSRRKSKKNKRDIFFEVKGILEYVLEQVGITGLDFVEDDKQEGYNICCKCLYKKKTIGVIKVLDDNTLSNFSQATKDIGLFEVSLTKVIKFIKHQVDYKPLPKFPEVVLGMTLIVPEDVSIKDLISNINNRNEALIEDISVIDIYRGEQIGEDKKSVVLDLVYRASDRTLTESEVQKVHNSILESLKKLGVKHR